MFSQVNLRKIFFPILVYFALTTPLFAQTVENNSDSQRPSDQDINPPPVRPPLPKKPPTSIPSPEELLPFPATPPEESLDRNERITVTKFIFTGNTLFTGEELSRRFTQGLTNKPLSLIRLLEIANDIAQLYGEQGYSTSGAIISIPEVTQEKGKGIVTVKIIEGELSQIKVVAPEDSLQLDPEYIRSRLKLATAKPLNVYKLQEALQLLQLNPLIDGISATLSADATPAQSILEVKVLEADTFNWQLFADNHRSPAVGSFRRGSTISENNLLGSGDRLSLSYANTDGSDAYDIAYILPINPRNGTISFAYSNTESEVVESPFNELDLESETSSYELSWRQPIIQSIDRHTNTFNEVDLGMTAYWRGSNSLLEDDPSPILGIETDGDINIAALRFTQEWTRQNSQSVLALRSEFSLGLDIFNSTINEQLPETERIPDSRFFAWRGQTQYVYLLAPDTLLFLRGSLQIANDALFGAEQLSLGGFNTVRGYRQDALLTDNGFLASAELRIPIVKGFSESGII